MSVAPSPGLQARLAEREALLAELIDVMIRDLGLEREPDEIDPDTPLFATGLGLDSVDAVELLVMLEVDFGVKLDGETEGRRALRTVNGMVDLILARREAHP